MARSSPHHPLLLDQIQLSESKIELTLEIPHDLPCLQGHFPEFAILPGVVQLQWAVEYAHQFLGMPINIPVVDRLKFTAPIRPNSCVTLILEHFAHAGFTEFKYANLEYQFSQGRLSHG